MDASHETKVAKEAASDSAGSNDSERIMASPRTMTSSRWSSILGGEGVPVGARIAPPPHRCRLLGAAHDEVPPDEEAKDSAPSSTIISHSRIGKGRASVVANCCESATADVFKQQFEEDDGKDIQYRSCSWQRTTAILFSQAMCLAIMTFPASYRALGLLPGLLVTIAMAGTVVYTSLISWQFCLRHPEVRDICDIGRLIFGGSELAWWLTAAMFVLNNMLIMAIHIVVGQNYVFAMFAPNKTFLPCPSLILSVMITALSWLFSLPRTLLHLSHVAGISSLATLISVVLATIFTAVQAHPSTLATPGHKPSFSIHVLAPPPTTTFISGTMAFLNISYTLIGQASLPSYIAEMRDPREFPKALWLCTVGEVIVYTVVGGVIYVYTGNEYITNPAFGVLGETYKKIAYSFMVPTIIFVGVLYGSVTGRILFLRAFQGTRHLHTHTALGWVSWGGIQLCLWLAAFLIAETIPFFDALLSIMTSFFDTFFGFIYWSVAYFRMHQTDSDRFSIVTPLRANITHMVHAILILIGLFFLTGGTYASIGGIAERFGSGTAKVFSCDMRV